MTDALYRAMDVKDNLECIIEDTQDLPGVSDLCMAEMYLRHYIRHEMERQKDPNAVSDAVDSS